MKLSPKKLFFIPKFGILFLTLLLTACASQPAPVEDASTVINNSSPDLSSDSSSSNVPTGESGGLQGRPLQPGESINAEIISPRRAPPPVVAKLLRQSEEASAQQQWPKAETYLQRALRISPKNALLWSRMAETKLKQGKNIQAIQFANKSNAITKDVNLRQRNDAIVIAAER